MRVFIFVRATNTTVSCRFVAQSQSPNPTSNNTQPMHQRVDQPVCVCVCVWWLGGRKSTACNEQFEVCMDGTEHVNWPKPLTGSALTILIIQLQLSLINSILHTSMASNNVSSDIQDIATKTLYFERTAHSPCFVRFSHI